ncbi:hypothetical protein GWK47_053884 [Chionoecetes opilio]|uniref:Uncharacterized protein n=1 Tax=Chionoecetes opilio TaxID=41210 RepID=A0A8J4XZ84_CHIOP|nr:hypothetical protein GWK47_053884 [Chionoecetes opilio]
MPAGVCVWPLKPAARRAPPSRITKLSLEGPRVTRIVATHLRAHSPACFGGTGVEWEVFTPPGSPVGAPSAVCPGVKPQIWVGRYSVGMLYAVIRGGVRRSPGELAGGRSAGARVWEVTSCGGLPICCCNHRWKETRCNLVHFNNLIPVRQHDCSRSSPRLLKRVHRGQGRDAHPPFSPTTPLSSTCSNPAGDFVDYLTAKTELAAEEIDLLV